MSFAGVNAKRSMKALVRSRDEAVAARLLNFMAKEVRKNPWQPGYGGVCRDSELIFGEVKIELSITNRNERYWSINHCVATRLECIDAIVRSFGPDGERIRNLTRDQWARFLDAIDTQDQEEKADAK